MTKRKDTEWDSDTNFLNLLVKVTEVGSKMDGMTVAMETLNTNMKELRDGTKADIEFLKVDKISRAEAVRIQTDAMTAHAELVENVTGVTKEVTLLKEGKIAFRAQMRVWIFIGAGIGSVLGAILMLLITIFINTHFHA